MGEQAALVPLTHKKMLQPCAAGPRVAAGDRVRLQPYNSANFTRRVRRCHPTRLEQCGVHVRASSSPTAATTDTGPPTTASGEGAPRERGEGRSHETDVVVIGSGAL